MVQAHSLSDFILSLVSASASNSASLLFSKPFTNLKYLIKMTEFEKENLSLPFFSERSLLLYDRKFRG